VKVADAALSNRLVRGPRRATPADSNARRIAKSLALVSAVSVSPLAPRGEWWQRLVPTQRQDPPRSNE
jgi:hypothetical protein